MSFKSNLLSIQYSLRDLVNMSTSWSLAQTISVLGPFMERVDLMQCE